MTKTVTSAQSARSARSAEYAFATVLRQRRKALDLTQRDLAQRVGCTEDLIRKMEAGRRKPSRQLAGLLATHLNIAPHAREAFVALARSDSTAQASPASINAANQIGNLPAPQTALLGRAADVQRIGVKVIKPEVRLVTLTGTGGIGKTRLALEVAQTVRQQFVGGAWFVALESVPAHAFVFDAVASVMGLAVKGDVSMKTQVIAAIGAKRILLVLDNFEHVLAAAPDLHEVLAACPNVTVLVTSRERLKLRAEHVMVVRPLAVPDVGEPVVQTAEAPAVQLFVDRAGMVVPEFEVTAANAPQIATLCRQLEGIPLAIELMAARAGMYSLSALLDGLTSKLLSTRSELIDVPARQQSLWHAVAWSYHLLTDTEQRCFRRLATLPGGASLEAASAICDVPLVEQVLQSLIDKSLILRSEHIGVVRFHMHMPLREFGRAMLADAGEEQLNSRVMVDHFTDTVERLYQRYAAGAPDMDAHWRTLELDLDNLRAAAQWADEVGNVVAFVRLSSGMRRFMWVRGHSVEGLRLAQRAVALIEGASAMEEALHTRLRADAYGTLGMHLMNAGDNTLGIDYLRKSADHAREQAYTLRLISSLINLGNGLANTGAYAEAERVCVECADLCQRVGDTYGLADVHVCLGLVAFFQSRLSEARDQFNTALGLHRQINNTSAMLVAMGNLGVVHEHMGEYAEALRFNEQSLSLARESEMPLLVAGITGNMAGLHVKLGDLAAARRHLSESLRLSQQIQELEYLANGLVTASKIALLSEEPDAAATFLGMAYRVHQDRHASFTPDNQPEVDEIRATLGDAAVDAAAAAQADASLQDMTGQACAWLSGDL